MKRLLIFLLAAVLLVGAAAPEETKAEEYMTVSEFVEAYGFSHGYTNAMEQYTYFLCFYAASTDRYTFICSNTIPTFGWDATNGFLTFRNFSGYKYQFYSDKSTCSSGSTKSVYITSEGGEIIYMNFSVPEFEGSDQVSDTITFIPTYVEPITATVQMQISDTSAEVNFNVTGRSENFYVELVGSDTLDGEFISVGTSGFYITSGAGSYTFKNLVPGYYYYVNLLLNDGTVLATSGTEYVMKDDAEINLEITESDAVITGTYTLSGGAYIAAAVYLQKSTSGNFWVNVASNSSAVAGTDTLSCDAQDGFLYRLYVEYVCRNDDGVDVSGTAESNMIGYAAPTPTPKPTNTPTPTPTIGPSPTPTPTLIPDAELMESTSDFSFIVLMVMLLMQDFPLNLFLVCLLLLVGLVLFDDTKRGLKRK